MCKLQSNPDRSHVCGENSIEPSYCFHVCDDGASDWFSCLRCEFYWASSPIPITVTAFSASSKPIKQKKLRGTRIGRSSSAPFVRLLAYAAFFDSW